MNLTRRSHPIRRLALLLAMLLLGVALLLTQSSTTMAHNLQTKLADMFFDPNTQALLDARIAGGWVPGTPLLQAGDELGLIIKGIPRDGTSTGVGGYLDFYIPTGTQVVDVAYVKTGSNPADGINGWDKVAMKGQSLIAMGDGPIGAKAQAGLIGLTLGPNVNGVSAKVVEDGTGLMRGTIAGVYGDTGIFFSTSPDTNYDSWAETGGYDQSIGTGGDNLLTNNSGDVVLPLNKWDAEQLLAWGAKSPITAIVDTPDQRGNSPWGLGNGVAGPQSGYAWDFDWDFWRLSPKTAADMREASNQMGPWQRIQYPGSRVSYDVPGLKSTTLGIASIDASNLGRNLVTNPLPTTTGQTNNTPNVVRWSVGQVSDLVPEYVWVKIKVVNPANIVNASGCPVFDAGAFGGDAGGNDNGKDHLWRYYEPSRISWNACLGPIKTASKQIVAPGETFTFTLKVYNLDIDTDYTNVVIKDTLPSGLQFVSASPAQNSGPNPLVWNVPSLMRGQAFSATVTVKATGTGPQTNTLCVEAPGGYLSCTEEVVIVGLIPDLRQSKSVTPTSITPGGTVQYTVTVDNVGTGPTGSPVTISELLPAGFTYLSKDSVTINGANVTGTTTVNSSDPNKPIFTVPGAINAGQKLQIKFSAQVAANAPPGEYCNVFTVTQGGTPLTSGSLACVNVGGGSIGDTVYHDWNGNGVQDAGDEGAAGLTVTLYAGACPPAGAPLQTKTTDANGNYLFSGLTNATYCVVVDVPPGYTVTADPQGPLNGQATVTLPTATSQNLDIDFGLKPGGSGVIGDKVFDDVNENGVFDGGDVGINGATIKLYEDTNGNGVIDPGDTLIATTTSAGGGNYSFTGLAEDLDYLVEVSLADPAVDGFYPNPYVASTPLLIPVANLTGTFDEADFGFFDSPPSSIGDQLCIDSNEDGLCTGGEPPVPNVDVRLYKDVNGNGVLDAADVLLTTTTSDANGQYTFAGLAPGDYIVDIDNTDPDIPVGYAPAKDEIAVTDLPSGTDRTDVDFPFVPLLRKEVSPTGAQAPGTTLTYSLFPRYPGSTLLNELTIWDPIPDGTTFQSVAQNGTYNAAADEVEWNLGSNTPGAPSANLGSFFCPASTTLTADADTFINSASPGNNNGGIATLSVDSNNIHHSLVHFAVSGGTLPGGAIFQSAQFLVTVEGGQNANRTAQVRPLNRTWTEGTGNNAACASVGSGATWNAATCNGLGSGWDGANANFATAAPYGASLGTIIPAVDELTYSTNVSTAVQGWIDGSLTNGGLVLLANGSDTGTVTFHSRTATDVNKRPRLVINYLVPTPGGCTQTARIYATQDAYINADKPAEIKNTTELRTTYDANAAKRLRALLQFDLSSIPPGSVINSANFRINVTDDNNHTVEIHALTNSWLESQVTWLSRNKATALNWTTAGGDFTGTIYNTFNPTPPANGYTNVPVTSLVQGWYDGSVPNNGMILVPTTPAGGNNTIKYSSSESASPPYLEVTYVSSIVDTTLTAIRDSYIDAANPTTNNGPSTTLQTKYDTSTAKRQRALVQFDLSTIPAAATINSAQFRLNTTQVANHTVEIRRVTNPWLQNEVTWLNRLTGTPWTTAGGDFGATTYGSFTANLLGYNSVNVTTLAQGWLAGTFANNGMILLPVSGSNSTAKYSSREAVGLEPLLQVRYTAPTAGGTRTNSLAAEPTLVTGGDDIKVAITLKAEAIIDNVTPGALTPTGVNGASASCPNPPVLLSANDDLDGTTTDAVVWQWVCTATQGAVPGSVKFSAPASGTLPPAEGGGVVNFSAATSNSVLVSPPLTFQVTIDNPNSLTEVINQGFIYSRQPDTYTQLTPDLCYTVNFAGTDTLYVIAEDGTPTTLGATGTANLEALAWNPAGTVLYGASDNQLYTLNTTTGVATALPNNITSGGSLRGSLGVQATTYITGLSFDPISGNLYAIGRRQDGNVNNTLLDFLFQINPTTGQAVQNAFGLAIDYVVVQTNTLSTALYNVADIAFEPTSGVLYAIANDSTAGSNDLDRLVTINKVTGAVTDVARLINDDTALGLNDMADLSFLASGSGTVLHGVTGTGSAVPDNLWEIDVATAGATSVATLPAGTTNYRGLACDPGDYQVAPGKETIPETPSNEVETPLPSGSIGDFVWYDLDGDTVQDGGAEIGAPNTTLTLYKDLNNNDAIDPGEPILAAVTTDANGLYVFPNIPPGEYVVKVDEQQVPAPPSSANAGLIGFMVTTTGSTYPVTISCVGLICTNETNADFGVIESAEVEGTVFHDVNHDSVLNGADYGLYDSVGPKTVTVTLIGTDFGGNPVNLSTETDANGEYKFIVPPGNYTIGYSSLDVNAINSTLTEPTTPLTISFTAVAGVEYTGFDFGVDNPGSIGDRVWNDANGNGQQNAGEPGIGGVTVNLYAADGTTLLATTATDGFGFYKFLGLPDATYVVKVDTTTLPAGYVARGEGDPGVACGVGCDSTITAVIAGGNALTNVDFGYQAPAGTFPISGNIWNDNGAGGGGVGNGVKGGTEPNLANVTVCLYQSDGTTVITCVQTDASGNYTFPGNPNGTYVVKVDTTTLPSNSFYQTGDPDSVCPSAGCNNQTTVTVNGAAITGRNFGYLEDPGSISGSVCDGNGNGLCDGGDTPYTEVQVTLRYAGDDGFLNTPDDVLTNQMTSGGNYSFTGLEPGQYQVTIATPVDRDNLADADGGNPNNIAVTLALGQDVVDRDFELQPPLKVGGALWSDNGAGGGTLGDGIRNGTEPGIAGVDVQLYSDVDNSGTYTPGDTLVASTTSDANGEYTFAGLPPGNYIVVIPASEFGSGQPLSGATSSATGQIDPDNNVKNDDNGFPLTGQQTIVTFATTLSVGGEPDTPVDGDGTNSNRTVDLGFVPGPTAIRLSDIAVSGPARSGLAAVAGLALLVGATLGVVSYLRRQPARS